MKDFLAGERAGILVIAKLPTDIQAYLGAKSSRVLLSAETVKSHRHHGWTPEEFGHLQALLDYGQVWSDKENHIIVAHQDGIWRMAALKVTKNRREVYLSSFHQSKRRQINALRARWRNLRAE